MVPSPPAPSHPQLHRSLGVAHATLLGLGSMVGTGVFVSIGIAAGLAGPSVVLAIALAALVAAANALSSAQLAANFPVSGGTYEYAGRLLSPAAGFTAGWMFLCAKAASAATAALGFAGYLLALLGAEGGSFTVPIAVAITAVLTAVCLAGIKRSAVTNMVIVSVTLAALGLFVVLGAPTAARNAPGTLAPLFPDRGGAGAFFHAAALMFVAFTGYGRIATMGEEIRDPRRNIPIAIITTIVVVTALYIAVAVVAVGAIGALALAEATGGGAAPLEVAARSFTAAPWVAYPVAIGAVTAMLGVLLNLILGLSRVLLAMGRRGDMPGVTARISHATNTPAAAIVVVGVAIAALALVGSVRLTWSFSAFTVLVYYALTNASALRLSREQRLFPRIIPAAGLVACLGLAFLVEPRIWLTGLGVITAGLAWHAAARRFARPRGG